MVNEVSNISSIEKLQETMLGFPQVEVETNHLWSGGMYLREILIPADTLIVGKVHKTDHFCMVVKGTVVVSNEEGSTTYVAPSYIAARAGTKRAIYALEDSVWVNVHRTEETDLDKLEDELVMPDPASPFLPGNKLNPALQGTSVPKVEKQ